MSSNENKKPGPSDVSSKNPILNTDKDIKRDEQQQKRKEMQKDTPCLQKSNLTSVAILISKQISAKRTLSQIKKGITSS